MNNLKWNTRVNRNLSREEYWEEDIRRGKEFPKRKHVKSFYLTNHVIMKIVEEAMKIGLTPSAYIEQLIRSITNERRSP